MTEKPSATGAIALDELDAETAGETMPPVDQEHVVGRPLPRVPKLWWFTGTLGALTLVAAIVISLLPSGYLVDAPGSAFDTTELVTVPDSVESFEHEGGLRLVTVAETAEPIFGQALAGWLDPDTDVFRRTEVMGDTPREEELRFQLVLMQNAKRAAVYQAMDALGLPATMVGGGVFVSRIESDSPADGALNIGDTITEIDGEPIHTTEDVARFMEEAEPGDEVTLIVDRHGVSQQTEVDLTLGKVEREDGTAPFIGIYMETRPQFDFPFEVGFDTGDIGGPSAGLSLTLTLIDRLSEEGVTNGHDVAVTGSIQLDGSVGSIGGIRQKVAAVRDAGLHYFMVPANNAAEACEVVGDPYPESDDATDTGEGERAVAPPKCGDAESGVLIIPVTTLDDALKELAGLPDVDSD